MSFNTNYEKRMTYIFAVHFNANKAMLYINMKLYTNNSQLENM